MMNTTDRAALLARFGDGGPRSPEEEERLQALLAETGDSTATGDRPVPVTNNLLPYQDFMARDQGAGPTGDAPGQAPPLPARAPFTPPAGITNHPQQRRNGLFDPYLNAVANAPNYSGGAPTGGPRPLPPARPLPRGNGMMAQGLPPGSYGPPAGPPPVRPQMPSRYPSAPPPTPEEMMARYQGRY